MSKNKMSIITSDDDREFNRLMSEAFEKGGRLVGGIKSIPKKDNSGYDYITFVSYGQEGVLN